MIVMEKVLVKINLVFDMFMCYFDGLFCWNMVMNVVDLVDYVIVEIYY